MHLTILYTANLRGDLALLPRLHTFLRQLREQVAGAGRVLLLDAGNACDSAVWHCDVTGGRSAVLVLDAMGYQAANVAGFLTEAGREKLAENLLALALVDEAKSWTQDGVVVTATNDTPDHDHDLCILLEPGEATRLDGRWLSLADVKAGQVGVVQIGPKDGNGTLSIQHSEIMTIPANMPPDPTIAGTVDFVLEEARYYSRRG